MVVRHLKASSLSKSSKLTISVRKMNGSKPVPLWSTLSGMVEEILRFEVGKNTLNLFMK